MATTSIWPVKGYLGRVVLYIENPDKTENPNKYEKPEMGDDDLGSLADVIEYAVDGEKTAMRRFVSGVNCTPETARSEMIRTKRLYEKEGGRVGFHGYQSFAEGEVTPETAHKIGVRLAEELWGDDFQVIVATHLDKTNHIHSHFVLNSVSYRDGRRFHNSRSDYRKMSEASDRLCREYGLSVIEKPAPGKTKHYSEWAAEKNGKPTWRSVIKTDIDEAIASSMTDKQFFAALKQKGYEVKIGKDISVRPPGKERFFRLARNFGDGYTQEAIKQRILEQGKPRRTQPRCARHHKRYRKTLTRSRCRKVGGLMGLYLYYQYLLGIIPKQKNASRYVNPAVKTDLARLEKISAETILLFKYRIETLGQLEAFRDRKAAEMEVYGAYRNDIWRLIKKSKTDQEKSSLKTEVTITTETLKALRREVRLANDIAKRSLEMKQNIAAAKRINNKEVIEKEEEKDERIRRSG